MIQDNQNNFSIIKVIIEKLIINQGSFSYNICLVCKGSILNIHNTIIILDIIQAYNNQADTGGVIYLADTQNQNNNITNSELKYNKSSLGGAIFSKNSELNGENVKVQENQSNVGGGICFIDKIPSILQLQNQQNQRRSLISENLQLIQNNQINNNIAFIYGPQFTTLPQGMKIKNQDLLQEQLFQFSSGDSINIEIEIVDVKNQVICLQKNHKFNEFLIEQKKFDISRIGSNMAIIGDLIPDEENYDYENCVFQLKDIKIVGIPDSKSVILFKNNNYLETNFYNLETKEYSIEIELTIYFSQCVIGQIYKQQVGDFFECQACLEGFYSFQDPQIEIPHSCNQCPQEGFFCQANTLIIKDTFWKSSTQSDQIYLCTNPSNCQEETNYKQNGQVNKICKQGTIGPLCQTCDQFGEVWGNKYSQDNKYECIDCKELTSNILILKTVLIGLLEILYLQFAVQRAIKMQINQSLGYYLRKTGMLMIQKTCFIDITTWHVKQFFHYMALSKFLLDVNQYEIYKGSTDYIMFLPTLFSSPVQLFYNKFDCLITRYITNYEQLMYVRAIWVTLIPSIYWFFVAIIIKLLMIKGSFKNDNRVFFMVGVLCLLYLQPGIISKLLGTIICTQIDDVYYIKEELTLQCFTKFHTEYSLFCALPLLSLWTVFIPLYLFKKVRNTVQQLKSAWYTHRIKIGFLKGEYKKDYYYWEFIRMYKKILIVFIFNFLPNRQLKIVITQIILFIYMNVTIQLKPYKFGSFNKKDQFSMITLISLGLINMIIANSEYEYMQYICSIISSIVHQTYFIYLLSMIFYYKVEKTLKKPIKKIKLYLFHNFSYTQRYLSKPQVDNLQRFLQWKQLLKTLRKVHFFKFETRAKKQNFGIYKTSSQNLKKSAKLSQQSNQKLSISNFFSESLSSNLSMFSPINKKTLQKKTQRKKQTFKKEIQIQSIENSIDDKEIDNRIEQLNDFFDMKSPTASPSQNLLKNSLNQDHTSKNQYPFFQNQNSTRILKHQNTSFSIKQNRKSKYQKKQSQNSNKYVQSAQSFSNNNLDLSLIKQQQDYVQSHKITEENQSQNSFNDYFNDDNAQNISKLYRNSNLSLKNSKKSSKNWKFKKISVDSQQQNYNQFMEQTPPSNSQLLQSSTTSPKSTKADLNTDTFYIQSSNSDENKEQQLKQSYPKKSSFNSNVNSFNKQNGSPRQKFKKQGSNKQNKK